ncbi:MAG: hypothetical protein Q8Q67_01940 [bacterium]|nr:hypothetical protein [bacterium]
MKKINKTVAAQITSGAFKFLGLAFVLLVIVVLVIPFTLSIIKGRDIAPVDDSKLQLQTINIPVEDNSFYDLEKTRDIINTNSVPKGKQLVSDYLTSAEWDEEAVEQLLADNEVALQHFTDAAAKGLFQLPDADDQSKISLDMPVTPLNSWRETSRLSGVKAIWLASSGRSEEALDEAFKSIIVGNAIENSQGLVITHLVGIAIKNTGLDVLQKVISKIPSDSRLLAEYKLKLESLQATGNSAPYITEYLVTKEALANVHNDRYNQFGLVSKILLKNKFYYKQNLTQSYYFDFYNNLSIEAGKNCAEVKTVQSQSMLLEESNFIKMYFTENALGKSLMHIPEVALNNVLASKCATEAKLKETILLFENRE